MTDVPELLPLRLTCRKQLPRASDLDRLDHLAVVLVGSKATQLLRGLPRHAAIGRLAGRMQRHKRVDGTLSLDTPRGTTISIHFHKADSAHSSLTRSRLIVKRCLENDPARVGICCLGGDEGRTARAEQDLIAALGAACFGLPDFRSKAKPKRLASAVVFGPRAPNLKRLETEARANNLARWLTATPPNMLTSPSYQSIAKTLAEAAGLRFEFLGEDKLTKLGAGAFLAVSQGNPTRDAGIVRLSFRPKGSAGPELALVGKGILFDTGGTNLKPFKSMLDMHTDMQGSAVALATGLALAELKVPFAFDVWLAITPNKISGTAYTSQDVVNAANGKTIQVIHTDAEGRMVLADTLALAAREQPKVLIDYATLTGTCIAALTTRYSGVFSNRRNAHDLLVANGIDSGERVWSFPMDEDYDEAIKSEIADLKQCAADGSGDHILAARFLSHFVPRAVAWVHMDLSAGQHKGGLGHIPSEITGFGVRYTLHLLLNRFDGPVAFADALN